MGNSESNTLDQFYDRYYQQHLKNPYVEGGVLGGALGGAPTKYDNLKDYADSAHAMAKEELIRSIAEDLADSLKLDVKFARDAKIEDVVKKMKEQIPHPSNKKSLKANAQLQEKLCQRIASSINKRYDAEIVSKDDNPEEVCRKVSELLYSLFNGLHSEFLEVSGDISRILSNLRILQQYVDGAHKKLMDDLQKANDSQESVEMKYMKDLYEKISQEIHRQMRLLENLTDSVIGPLNKSLIKLLEDNKDFTGLVQDMEGLVGTAQFSDRLANLLLGMNAVAHSAELVNDALKKLGLSLNEYKEVKGLKELQDKVYDLVQDKSKQEDAAKLMAAAEILYKNDMDKDEIVEHLEKKKGGYFGGDSFADMSDEMTKKNVNDSPFKGRVAAKRQSINKQVEQKQKFRKLLFRDFNKKLKSHYQRISASLTKLSKKLGNEIELSENLNMFLKQLVLFKASQPNSRQDLYVALTGYKNTTESNYQKYQFLENLRQMSETLELLMKEKNGDNFKPIKKAMDDMVKLVDDFNDTFSKHLTSFSANINRDDHVEGGEELKLEHQDLGVDEVAERVGGDIFAQISSIENTDLSAGEAGILGGMMEELNESDIKYFQGMEKTIREFEYYYKIAGIDENMKKMSKDMDANTKNYENVLGEEAGAIIDRIQEKYNAEMKRIEESEAGDEVKNASEFLLEYVRSAKVEMLEAAQALDLYLSKFTKQVQLKPNEIKKFAQLVEDVVVIAQWFNQQAGDDLEKAMNNELNVLNRENAINYVKQIEKALKGMRALENIISVFSRVNIKVSSEIKSFMSSGMMFKAMMKYLVASSISMSRDDANIYNVQLASKSGPVQQSQDPLLVGSEDKAIDDAVDEIFRYCLKSMASKVFVVVGNYSLFNRPATNFNSSDALPNKPLRQIMGGSHCSDAIPEASELYLRLPLLAEWYRDVFDFKNEGSDVVISHIPDIDGVWKDFAQVIFWDARNVQGSYPVAYAERLISAINKIYKHYNGKNCRDIIDEFILEVNRRYGFMMRNEIQAYISERGESEDLERKLDQLDDDNELEDFDILGSNEYSGRRSAPSDRYRVFKPSKAQEKRALQLFHDAVKGFRQRVERELRLNNEEALQIMTQFDKTSLNNIIRQTERRMRNAGESSERCAIVMEQLHGVDKYGDVDKHRVMMFHEVVITPLTVLHAVQLKLEELKRDSDSDNLQKLVNCLMDVGVDMNGLVEVYITGSGDDRHPVVNASKLEEHCRRLFEQVKINLKEMRKHLPQELVDRYESNDEELSMVNIERRLFDRMFKNKDKQGLDKINEQLKESYSALRQNAGKPYQDLVLWDMEDGVVAEEGLVYQLNRNIKSFLEVMRDGSSNKWYKALLEKFAYGHNAKEIVQGKALTKTDPSAVDAGDNILNSENAEEIKKIMTEKYGENRPEANVPKFLEDDLDKVPEYQKEMMRAYLPVYQKQLENICNRSEFLKSLIEESSLKLAGEVDDEASAKGRFVHLLDEVCSTSRSLCKCIKEVRKELSDVPLYMEVYADSLKDYQNRNRHYPFMPLSNLTHLMVDDKRSVLIPNENSAIGSAEFKMAYGVRGILDTHQKISMDYMPGMETIIEVFHSRLGSEMNFSKSRMNDLIQDMLPLMRYVIDIQVFDRDLSGHAQDILANERYSCQASMDSYWKQLQNITLLVENDNIKEAVGRLMGCTSNVGGMNALRGLDRRDLRVYNILDLNVVPVNFHALQREVAFVNLLNYAYTFDQLIDNVEQNESLRSQLKDPMGDRNIPGAVAQTLEGDRMAGIPAPKYLKEHVYERLNLDANASAYNKKLIRNIIFIVQLQRAVRKLMKQQLEWNRDPVVQGHPIVNEDITDYTENNMNDNGELDPAYFN